MKRTIITCFLFLQTPVFFVATAAASQTYSVTSEFANIRSGPGTKYEILWKAEQYYPVTVTRKKGKWYLFKDFEGDSGWIHNSLLGKVKSAVVIKDKCNIRSGPSTRNRIVFTVEKGVPFKILSRKGNWLRIEHANGDRGWIYKSLVKVY